MRIYFERTGGFMGMRIAGSVDTKSLPIEEEMKLRDMLDAANFFELPEAAPEAQEGADQFSYKLVVEDEGREHTVETTDATAPETLRPLLRRLTMLTRPRRE